MGVHGLWKLLEPAGKIVPLEGMAGKVLAVDVSIWLHQAMKGMHDSYGAPVAVAHLLILFHRLCKLLFYRIKPVFVFDGGVPALKRETMANRRKVRSSAKSEALKVRGKLFKNLLKHEAVRQMLSHGQSSEILGLSSLALPGSSVEEELYKLPPLAEKPNEDRSEEEYSSEDDGNIKFAEDINTIDVTSSDFKNLPPEVRHEILLELIETRKQSSWKTLDKMPKESDSFSDFQMNRLLKRRAVQSSLDEVGKEMGGRTMSMKDLEDLLVTNPQSLENEDFLQGKRIAQSEDARYLLVHRSDDASEPAVKEQSEDKIDVKKEPICEDDFESSSSFVETVPEGEVKVEEDLTQEEIYDLIKKENAASCPKPTKLTKERKMKLTDDVIEILPLLGAEGAAKLQNFNAIGGVMSDVGQPGEEEVAKERKAEDVEVKVENVNMQISRVAEETSDGIRTVSEGIAPGACAVPRIEVESARDEEPEPTSEMLPAEDSSKKLEDDQLKEARLLASPVRDSSPLSEDSENDFVDVPGEFSFSEPSCDKISPEVVKIGSGAPIEIVIDTNKKDAEDIFSDVFRNSAKGIVGETQSPEKTIPERIQPIDIPKASMTEGDLREMQKSIESEYFDLMQEQGRQERVAQSISDQMNSDAQELLRLFGVPYVVAPMEAEAQCAVLNVIGLTDGTITDDSDIWLFGGKVVYKNFFNQKKHVHQFRSEDIERCFKLSREDMIKIALLVGSDYTSGLEGIGPVTALEILAAFPSAKDDGLLSGLKHFREWVSDGSDLGPNRRALRRKMRNTKIIPGFPSEAVVDAYLHPQVDDSKEPFSWAKPNVSLLEKYVKVKFGWTAEKCGELLKPVMKNLLDNKANTTLDKYFHPMLKETQLEGVLSKRVENALKHLRNEQPNPDPDDSEPERKRSKTKKASETKTTKPKSTNQNKDSVIPQKLAMEKIFEDRKRSAIKIFKKSTKKANARKAKPLVKAEVNLSESSSNSD